jgi:elongator complex protein 2
MSNTRLRLAISLNRHDGSDLSLSDSSISLVCCGPYILLLNAMKARYEARLKGHTGQVYLARFIPRIGLIDIEGRPTFEKEMEILSCSEDKTVRAWCRSEKDETIWTCTAVLEGHTDAITGLAVVSLPNGSVFCATASADCTIRVWHRTGNSNEKWHPLAKLEQKRSSVMITVALSILPGSRGVIMAAGGTNHKIHLYTIINESSSTSSYSSSSSSFQPTLNESNSSTMVNSSEYKVIEVLVLQGHSDWIRSLCFSRQTEFEQYDTLVQNKNTTIPFDTSNHSRFLMLASGAQDGKIRLWRISERNVDEDLITSSVITTSQETNEDTLLQTTVSDPDAETDVVLTTGEDIDHNGALASNKILSLSPGDFDRLLLLMDDSGVKDDSTSHSLLRRPSTFSIKTVNGNGDGVALFDVAFDSLLKGHEGWVFSTRWHPPIVIRDNSQTIKRAHLWQPPCLISSGSDKTVTIWQPRGVSDTIKNTMTVSDLWNGIWEPITRVGTGIGSASLGMYGAILLSDANTVVAHGFHGALHIWINSSSTQHDRSTYPLKVLDSVFDFGRRGKQQLTSWMSHQAPGGHFRSVTSLSWAPNGHYLLSASDDSTSRIWGPVKPFDEQNENDQQWHEISRPQIHGYAIKSVCLPSIQGRMHRFFSGSDEKVVRSFDAPELFLSTLQQVCEPALISSGYGSVQDDISDFEKIDDQTFYKRAAFAYVPELGLTNKAVMAALGSKDAEKATQDRYNLDGSDAISQLHDSNALALRNFIQEGGRGGGGEIDRDERIDYVKKSSQIKDKVIEPPLLPLPTITSHLVHSFAAPMEEVLVQDTRWPESEKMFGHANEIICVSSSSCGNVIASSCNARDEEDASIWLWDARTSQPLQQIVAHKLSVEKIEFSHSLTVLEKLGNTSIYYVKHSTQKQSNINLDSEFFVTSGRDRFVGFFIANGNKKYKLVKLLEGHKRQVWSVSVAPIPDSIQIFEMLPINKASKITSLPSVSTNVRLFASGARDHTIRLWSISRTTTPSTTPSTTLSIPNILCVGSIQFDSAVSALAFAPVCRVATFSDVSVDFLNPIACHIRTLLCVGLESGRLELYSVIGEKKTRDQESWEWTSKIITGINFQHHTGAIQAMAWRPLPVVDNIQCNKLMLATGGDDGAIIWHDLYTEEFLV